MIIWLAACGLCAAVFIDPYEFWVNSEPNYVAGAAAILFFGAGLAFWIYVIVSNSRDEANVALTSYINYNLTEAQRNELAEPDPWYEQNSGYMRWKRNARQSPLAYLIPKHKLVYR